MLVIKPYGRTQTSVTADKSRQRLWLPRTLSENAKAVAQLSSETDFLVAQWISVIDKIIKKPKQKSTDTKGKPTKLQYQAREFIGAAALEHLRHVTPPVDTKTWKWKLHPYAITDPPSPPKN